MINFLMSSSSNFVSSVFIYYLRLNLCILVFEPMIILNSSIKVSSIS